MKYMPRRVYNLGFLPDEIIYNYIKETVLKYTDHINLKSFNKNIIELKSKQKIGVIHYNMGIITKLECENKFFF